jgi:uncharacterized membrane protein
MEIFSDYPNGTLTLLRWIHILAGITWIGLLYYFNFVQGPSFAEFEADARSVATRKLVPRALAWFRYSAAVTFLAGAAYIIIKFGDIGWDKWTSDYGLVIISGMGLGTLMFLNVWGVIWRKQKVVIASAEKVAAGGEADPAATDAARRALLASRTNVVFSIPMLFFMVTAAHYATIASGSRRLFYGIVAAVVILLLELNALSGLTGSMKKPLEKVGSTIWSGFLLLAVLFLVLQIVVR